jgi:WD40 repeat protein
MQASATLLHNLKAYKDEVARISISPDGKTLAAHDDSILTLWDVETGSLLSKTEEIDDMFFEMTFSPDSKWIAAASWDRGALIRDARTGELKHILSCEDERTLSLSFSPNSRLLATGSENLRVWDMETGKLLHILSDPGAHPLSITSAVDRHEHVPEIFTVVFSHNGKALISGSPDTATICNWNTETWKLERTIRGYTLSFSPDGKLAVVRVPSDGYALVQIYETSTWQLQSTLETKGQGIFSSTFSPASKIIATCSGREITLWHVDTGEAIKNFTDPARKVSALVFSPDGTILIAGTRRCGLRVWDVESGDCLLVLEPKDGSRDPYRREGIRGDAPAFEVLSGDGGAKVAIAFPDGSVKIWDVKWEST